MASRHSPPSAKLDLANGAMLSHYRIVERIGAGGMGVVYRAVDLRLNRTVAVILVRPLSWVG